jgi:hypothetical protein
MISGDMGETLVFATDDVQQEQQPGQPAQNMHMQPPAAPPPRPQPQQPQTGKQPQQKSDGLITGNDLMDQMDAFFNFDA